MWLVILALSYLVHGTSLILSNGWENVTDPNSQIPEFLFDCLTKKDPWISPCSPSRKYFMLFDSQGYILEERMDQNDSSKHLLSYTNKAKKPIGTQIIDVEGHPKYLFQLEEVAQKKGSFYIATGSGQLLIAESQVNPNLLLREDHCGKDWSASAAESPVTVASTTTTASSITTLASTESAVTAIAVSTPAPANMDYTCDQAQWRLWKVDGRFLLIESVNKPGVFLNVDSVTHMVQLGIPEKMTGIYTSFLSNITLERSGGQGEPGIGDDAYGDLVVHYFGRDGSQQSGYVCDYEWGQDSADALCKYFGFGTGIPTFDGRYSSTNSPEYAVSEVKCDSENLEECKLRTICGPSSSCLSQNSMKAFGGKGYACNSGSATDVAGVVCGDQAQILNVLKQEISCDRSSLDNDRKSVAMMHNIQRQIERVSSTMFENKHWSEFLLPMPMAVSLMSALLLVSSQNDRDIELVNPSKGYWDHLKYNNTGDNIQFLSENVRDTFKLSYDNMGDIKVNTRNIQSNMLKALQNAFSTDEHEYKTVLPRNLRDIAKDAKNNKEKTELVHTAFITTNEIIKELLQALTNTKGYQQNKKVDTEKALNILNTTYNRDQKEYEKKVLEKQQYGAAVNQSRKAFLDAAKEAIKLQCVDETIECNNCTWVEPKITERCKPNKKEKICVERDAPICLEWENLPSSRHCIRRSPESKCIKWDFPCTEFVYEPEKSGSYCQDIGKFGKLCTQCKWIEEVSINLENVIDMTMKLKQSVLNDENSYSGVAAVIDELVFQVNMIDQDVRSYKRRKAAPRIAPPIDNATGKMSNETQSLKLEPFDSLVDLVKLLVDMDIDLLSGIKIPIAKKTCSYAISVKRFLDDLVLMQRKKIGEITEKEKIVVTTLLVQGKAIQKEANELKAKYEVSLKPSADHKTGEEVNILIENLTKRHKTEKKIESISNRMSNAISEMFKQQVEKQDINSIITKLVQCSRYLNLLSQQWVELRTFFKKLSNFLEIMQASIQEISEFYIDIGVNLPKPHLSKTFKDNLQKDIVNAHVNNIYVEQIANFYTKISDNGLLQGMALIESYLEKDDDPVMFERLKKYLKNKSIMIQEKIKLEISEEEARINDKIMKDISSMKNYLVCKIENAEDLSNKTLMALKSIEEADNVHKNILTTTSIISQYDLDEMNFFDDVSFDLDESVEAIENNEIGHIDIGNDDESWLY